MQLLLPDELQQEISASLQCPVLDTQRATKIRNTSLGQLRKIPARAGLQEIAHKSLKAEMTQVDNRHKVLQVA